MLSPVLTGLSKNILPRVKHTVIGSEWMEVHSFHGAVKKRYPLVEVYYKDPQNNEQSIRCYVHDSYIRHIQLNMTNYINSEYQNVTPFSHRLPISDPGDPHVDNGQESQGVGLVLCPASTNNSGHHTLSCT